MEYSGGRHGPWASLPALNAALPLFQCGVGQPVFPSVLLPHWQCGYNEK